MAYLGRDPQYGLFEVQTLSPNGSTQQFNLDFSISTAASVLVVKTGVVQKPGTDYNITSGGAAITFSVAPANGVSLYLVFLGKQFLVPDVVDGSITRDKLSQSLKRSVVPQWFSISSSTTVVAGGNYMVDSTSGAVTITLPASPSLGDTIKIVDATGNIATNNLTVSPGSEKIKGVSGNQIFTTNDLAVTLVYYNGTRGWVFAENHGIL
jgi:hypothetical protein